MEPTEKNVYDKMFKTPAEWAAAQGKDHRNYLRGPAPVYFYRNDGDERQLGVLQEGVIYEVSTDDNPKRQHLYEPDLEKRICKFEEVFLLRGFTGFDY